MVDEDRVTRMLLALRREVAGLRAMVAERDPHDELVLDAAKYRLVRAIDLCLRIGQHVIAAERLPVADDYASVFVILGDAGVIPADLVGPGQAMARFRNVLVHLYEEVDDDRVRRVLADDLSDLDRFARAIAALLAPPDRRHLP